MNFPWKKVFALIQKTGDKCLVVDPESEEIFVVMTLRNYEKILGKKQSVADLTEEELLDKINRDIAMWQTSKDIENCDCRESHADALSDEVEAEDSAEDERYYLESVE